MYNNSLLDVQMPTNWFNGILAVVAIVLLHFGGNLLSDYQDFKQGIDTDSSYGAKTITSGEFQPKEIRNFGFLILIIGIVLGIYLALNSGPHLWWIGGIGVLSALLYYKMKFNRLGDLCIFVAFGLLPPLGTAYVVTGMLLPFYFILSVPVGFLVVALLHANNTRDMKRDMEANIATPASTIGLKASIVYYDLLIIIPFIWLVIFSLLGDFPYLVLLTLMIFNSAFKCLKTMHSAKKDINNITFLDLQTAQLQLTFSLVFALTMMISALVLPMDWSFGG